MQTKSKIAPLEGCKQNLRNHNLLVFLWEGLLHTLRNTGQINGTNASKTPA